MKLNRTSLQNHEHFLILALPTSAQPQTTFHIGWRSNHRGRETSCVPGHPDALPLPQNHLSAHHVLFSELRKLNFFIQHMQHLEIFPFQIKQMVLLQRLGSSQPASLQIKKSFKYDLCSAEEVLRSPALLVQWCLSKGFYNNVSTADGSCVIYRKSSNRLQQSVLDFNQLFSTNLGGMHRCVWVCFRPAITCTVPTGFISVA